MNIDSDAQQLHDRSTRGEMLTAEEQAELERWYAHQDSAEATQLDVPSSTHGTGNLQRQVQATLDQLRVSTERIQALSVENETVRRENAELRRRLAQRSTSHTA